MSKLSPEATKTIIETVGNLLAQVLQKKRDLKERVERLEAIAKNQQLLLEDLIKNGVEP